MGTLQISDLMTGLTGPALTEAGVSAPIRGKYIHDRRIRKPDAAGIRPNRRARKASSSFIGFSIFEVLCGGLSIHCRLPIKLDLLAGVDNSPPRVDPPDLEAERFPAR